MVSLYERLTQQMEEAVNSAYIDESILDALGFQPIDLSDISIDKWMHKNLTELPEAAVHAAGFNPQDVTFDAEEFGHKVYTVDERAVLNEKDWAFAQKWGIAQLGIENLGKMVGKGASRYFMTGRNGTLTSGLGAAGEDNNFLLYEGSASGTITLPLTIENATAGAWATWANSQTDIIKLCGNHEAKNYSLSSSVLLYPKCMSYSMKRGGAAVREASPMQMALEAGVKAVIGVPDGYMVTKANALPVIGAADIALVDLSKIKIGYTRKMRTRTIADVEGRGAKVESEVWFVPYFIPQMITVAGTATYYKGVSTVVAINAA